MVRSGNDAAMALAEHVGGTVEGFADMMNAKAEALGLENSHFVNPHGLDARDHYTTASDLRIMAEAALSHPYLSRLARTLEVEFKPNPLGVPRIALTTNRLLGVYPGVIGLKTGFTSDAGRVLVSAHDHNGRTLIAVVMGSANHFADSRELLDYGSQVLSLRHRFIAPLLFEEGGGVGPQEDPPAPVHRERGCQPGPDYGHSVRPVGNDLVSCHRPGPGDRGVSPSIHPGDAGGCRLTEPFVEVVPEEQLRRRISELGVEISADYAGKAPVAVGVLKGCLPFLADLVRQLDEPMEVDFLSLTRFGQEGRVSISMDTTIQLEGRHVLIVEDLVDTGLTLTSLRRMIEVRDPASLRTVSLLDKAPRRIIDVPVEYRGFEVGDEFLLGYGLDWDGWYRNVRSLWAVMDLSELTRDSAAFAPVGHKQTR